MWFTKKSAEPKKPSSSSVFQAEIRRSTENWPITSNTGLVPLRSNAPYDHNANTDQTSYHAQFHQAQPQHMQVSGQSSTSENRPMYLQRLDGSPYDIPYKARKVKVAQDMYHGQMPPEYKRKQSVTEIPQATQTPSAVVPESPHDCATCGRKQVVSSTTGSQRHHPQCTKCGKSSSRSMERNQNGATPTIMQSRSVSQGTGIMLNSKSSDHTTTMSGPFPQRPCCDKCGRNRRVGMVPPARRIPSAPARATSAAVVSPVPPRVATQMQQDYFGPVPVRATNKTLPRLQSVQPQVGIDVTPPTASTYRASISSPFPDDAILLKSGQRKPMTRSQSIASTISRTFSRRKKGKVEATLPSPQPPVPHVTNADDLANSSTEAAHEIPTQDNTKLGSTVIPPDRPESPFSFVDKPAEEQAFEMNDMRVSKLIVPDNLMSGPLTAPLMVDRKEPDMTSLMHTRSKSEAFTSTLAVPQDNSTCQANHSTSRPPISRFKSLRGGVNRMASVTRSTSIKRLDSLKRTPSLWYRNDMALESAIGVY